MTEITEDTQDETQWPRADRAYDFVLPSYQWMITRWDAMDARIQSVLTFATSITLAAPVFAKALRQDVSFSSTWFTRAMALFVLLALAGLITRAFGTITLASPSVLHDKWLHFTEWQFRREAVFFAGKHFERNRRRVTVKGRVLTGMMVLFVLESICLLQWLRDAL